MNAIRVIICIFAALWSLLIVALVVLAIWALCGYIKGQKAEAVKTTQLSERSPARDNSAAGAAGYRVTLPKVSSTGKTEPAAA